MELLEKLKKERKDLDRRLFKLKKMIGNPDGSITSRQYDLMRRQSIVMRQVINDLDARIQDLEMN